MKFVNVLAGVLFATLATTAWADGAPAEETPAPAAPAAPEPAAEVTPAPQEAPAAEATAPAEEAPAEEAGKKLYAGLGLDLLKAKIGGDSAIVTGANLRLGYFVMPWLALEGQVFDGFTKPDLDRVAGTEADLGTSYGIFLKPHYTLGNFDLFASLGYADVDLSEKGGVGDVGDKGFAYGVGTRIPTSAGAFDFEYANLLDKNSVTVQALMFSYSRFF